MSNGLSLRNSVLLLGVLIVQLALQVVLIHRLSKEDDSETSIVYHDGEWPIFRSLDYLTQDAHPEHRL